MSYVALYRKYRPDNFKDVKGQDHIVTTLKNQIAADRIGHAYLFCGTRGTGKTTMAKLFAKTVNCEHPVDGNPCGECPTCKAIAAGASMSVIEIDAASNNGVDNVREIIDEVSFSPADGCRYKVYIIDEVHMLSPGAFNALLKTLEEPPSYCIFILATTDPQKVPVTILSRCQRYDFKRITVDTITDRLEELTAIENVSVEPRALRYIAKTADGAMRDALSILDQCIAFHYGETLTYDMVLNVLGAVDTRVFSNLLRQVIDHNVIGCITVLEDVVMQGRELGQFVADFTWYLRNLLIVKTTTNADEILDVSAENKSRLEEEAAMLEAPIIMRYIRVFSELSNKIRYASQKRIMIEVALIKLCTPQMERDDESIINRIRNLEDKLEKGVAIVPQNMAMNGALVQAESTGPKKELPPALPEDQQKIVDNWHKIITESDGSIASVLRGSRISIDDSGRLVIVVGTSIMSDRIGESPNKELLDEILNGYVGKKVDYTINILPQDKDIDSEYPDISKLAGINQDIDIEIETITDEEDDNFG